MKRKLVIIFIILITLINSMIPVVNGVQLIEKANLINDHKIKTHIKQENENGWFEVICNYICYKENNKKYPAYCVTNGVNGVDEEGSYTVETDKLLKDQIIYNAILNGHPYKSVTELGVESVDDAYVATKLAVKSILLDRNPAEYYKPINERGQKIINAMCEIIEKAKLGNKVNNHPLISINKQGSLVEYGNYYYQEYNVSADVNISQYSVNGISNFPEGSYITDTNCENRSKFAGKERFRIMIPKSELNKDLLGNINVLAECESNPIFYGESNSSKLQNYAITYDSYVEYEASTTYEKATNTSSIKIIKKDEETSKPIKDVLFGLYNRNNELIQQEKTNTEGIVVFSNLYQGTYNVKELNANENYEKDDTVYEINTEYNKEASKVITNKHKKGNLRISKVDKDNREMVLEGIEFDLIDSNKKVIAHLITDKDGVAQINNINIGCYTIKETKTKENYNLCIDNNIEVKWNETTDIVIENEKKKGQIKIIKQDKEDSQIKLEGVEFQIIDNNYNVVDQIKTDSLGEALSKKIAVGEYTIKEISLGTNEKYLLNEKEFKINVEENKVNKITIENEYKKGNLKITKVDKDNKEIVLEGIEFDLMDSNKKVIAHLITDKDGVAQINNINIGTYTIKETKTKENYNLCIDNNIEVKWNETTDILIENEKKKGQIKIIKQDKEDNQIKLEGVEFQIINSNNEVIENIKTDKNGIAITKRLPIGEYRIKETNIGPNTEYILEDVEYSINVEDEKINQIIIENIHKKGNLKITKVDKDDKTITLGAIEFDLINEEGEIVAHLTTDVNGEAYIEKINTGIYTLKETVTKREYNLCENRDINVEWNKTSDIIIENEKKKGQIKVIKYDAEKEEIKLKGVKFQIIDVNNKVVEEIITDTNGEAISSRLLIGEYKVKEIDLGENTNYIINGETNTVQVKNETVSEVIIENKHKKGDLRITKLDKDNRNILLEGVNFEITDAYGFKYKTTTNANGIAEVKDIRVGNINIKEVKTKDEYKLLDSEVEAEIEYNECLEITIENEKKKGQVEIYKTDKDNKNIKIPNVEFEILDKNDQVVDKIKTNEDGYAVSKLIPIGEYYLKEVKTNDRYVINNEIIKIQIKYDEILKLKVENEKIKGRIQVIKTSSNNSLILNIRAGEYLSEVEFGIFNSNNELVDTLVTDENGQAISKLLDIGRYKVKEKSTNKYYILNTNEFWVNIDKNNQIEVLKVENEAAIPKLDIEKIGTQYAEKNQEIKYEFDIKNISNINLDNFTWIEHITYEKSKVTKMVTGIYSQNIDYNIYYKTNKNGYKLFRTVNSQISEYLDFEKITLEKEEVITEIKVEYKTVCKDFNSIINPAIYTKVNNNVKKEDKILNLTQLYGNIQDYIVEDKSCFETIIKEKEILKKLPKTGC